MSPVLQIRDRLQRARLDPGEFLSHAESDLHYLLGLLDRALNLIEGQDEEIEVLETRVTELEATRPVKLRRVAFDPAKVYLDPDGEPALRLGLGGTLN